MTTKSLIIGAVLSTLALATPSQAALTDAADIAPLAPTSQNLARIDEKTAAEVAGLSVSIGFGKRFRGDRGFRSYGHRGRGFKRHRGFKRFGGFRRHRGLRRSGFRGHRGFRIRRGFSYRY